MLRRKIATLLILLLSSLFLTQCERNSLYTKTNDVLSLLGLDIFFSSSQINLQAGRLDYNNGGTYNFGTVTLGASSPAVVFTIQNTGTDNLNLTGVPLVAVSGYEAADFSVTDPAVTLLAPGVSTTFTITFTPGSAGIRDGIIRILYNSGKDSTYRINLTGTGSATPVPDINLVVGGEDYSSGSAYNFGSFAVGSSSAAVTFTIQNPGAANLTLTGTPAVATGGVNPSDFTVSGPAATTIASGMSETFTVTFSPTALGARSATIRIDSDDPDIGSYVVNLGGTGTPTPVPDINLQVSPTNYPSGGAYPFGSIAVGTPVPVTFTIQNLGNDTLNLTSVTTGGAEFVVSGLGTTTLITGDSTTFILTFTPSSVATFNDTLTIASDDPDAAENPYTISLSGTGTAGPMPDINLLVSGVDHPSGDTLTFGSGNVGSSSPDITFTIQNLGSNDLTLTGTPLVDISGTGAGDYLVTQPAISTIPVSGSATFTVTFMPTAMGPRDAEITIYSDDPDLGESPYTLYLSGTGTSPDIEVLVSGLPVATGALYTFPGVPVGGSSGNRTFTIDNSSGTGPLTISAPSKSGTHAAEFTVGTPGSTVIPAGGSTTFTVSFNPAGAGTRDATLTIANDDPDESPYEIYLQGEGTVPEINLQINSIDHSSGATYGYGIGNVGATIGPVTYTVQNLGTGELNVTGYSVTGTNQADFSVGGFTTGNITAGGSMAFSISFTPSGTGVRTALLTINSNDADEGTYTINLEGTGLAPEINLQYNSLDFPSGNGLGMVSVNVGSSTAPETFTIQNLGNADLTITGYTLTGANPGDFSVSGLGATSITFGGSATFDVIFTPTAAGPRSAVLTINSDDADEGSYVINLTGSGTTPEINIQVSGTNYLTGDTYMFAPTYRGSSNGPVTFTIQNLGSGTLDISGYTLAGANPSHFIVTGLGAMSIGPGGSSTFTITYNPGSSGSSLAGLFINSNDLDEGTYSISLMGSCLEPDINIKQGVMNYPSGSTYGFGSVQIGTTKTAIFTIQNAGTGILTISAPSTGDPVHFTASDPGVNGTEFYNLPPDTSVTITVAFAPTIAGSYNTALTIGSNDYDEGTYTINLSGTGSSIAVPDIDVKIGTGNISNGGNYNFGTVQQGTSKAVTFTIQNKGVGGLELSGITTVGTGYYSVSGLGATSIPGGGITTFTVTFAPTASGASIDSFTIVSNDPDDGGYTVNLDGTGTSGPVQDIKVTVDGIEYPPGSAYDFGFIGNGDSSAPVTFTITNNGTTNLTLSGPPALSNPTLFPVTGPGSTVISAGGSTTFDVSFTPDTIGPLSSQMVIFSDDPDDGSYSIDLNGGGSALPVPDINVEVASVNYPSGSCFDYDAVLLGDSTSVTYEIQNLSTTALLNLASVTITGVHFSEYAITSAPATIIPAGGSDTLDVMFTPGGEGLRAAAIRILSDDPDEVVYTVNLTGTGVMPIAVVLGGNGSNTAIYNPMTNTFAGGTGTTGNVGVGAHSILVTTGSHAGMHLIMHGNPGIPSSTTTWFDPSDWSISSGPTNSTLDAGASSFLVTSGVNINNIVLLIGSALNTNIYNPTLAGNFTDWTGHYLPSGYTAGAGSFPISLTGGNKLIVCGGMSDLTAAFDTSTNFFDFGPLLTANAGAGAHSFNITGTGPNSGKIMVVLGRGSALLNVYTPGTWGSFIGHGLNLTGNAGDGAHSVPITKGPHAGKVLIVHGNGLVTTSIYDPNQSVATSISTGPNLYSSAGAGAFAILVKNGPNKGNIIIVHGSSKLTTSIWDPLADPYIVTLTQGPILPNPAGTGAHCFPAK